MNTHYIWPYMVSVTYGSMLGDRYSLGKTWVASASSKLTERRATSSPGSSAVSLDRRSQIGLVNKQTINKKNKIWTMKAFRVIKTHELIRSLKSVRD